MTFDPSQFQPAPAAPPEAPQAAPAFNAAQFIPMETLDRRTGAPGNVRGAVGAASTPEDRLATLRRFAPDARPFGTDNFVYTDPRSQRLTVYNPRGMDWGDLASIRPEIGEFVGGAAGGALMAPAALAAAPFTGGASFLAIPAGVGLGAAAGREIATASTTALGDTIDTRGIGTRIGDAATTAGMNAVGVPIGNLLSRGASAMFGPVARAFGGRTGQNALNDFAGAGVTPSAGAVTGNRTTQLVEQGLAASPGGAQPMMARAEQQAAQAGQEAARIAGEYAPPATPGVAGATIRQGATNAVERFAARQGELYDDAFARVGVDTAAELPSVAALGRELNASLARAPESRAAVLQPVLNRIESLSADAGPNGLSFQALRDVRTDLGRIIGGAPNAAEAPSSATIVEMRRLYGALTDDMTAAARSQGPEAEQALALADRYTRLNRTQNLPHLERVLAQRTDEGVFNLAFPTNGRPDAQSLARLRRNMEPDEWNVLASTVIDRLGMPTAGQRGAEGGFSVSTFLTNLNRLTQNGPDAARVLFGGGDNARLLPELQRLARVTDRIRDVERVANPSGTARVGTILATGGGIGAAVNSDSPVQNVAGTVALSLIAPRYAANLITNPRFVSWLAGTAGHIAANPASTDHALLRLGQVATANPELREAITAFQEAFRTMPPQGAARLPAR